MVVFNAVCDVGCRCAGTGVDTVIAVGRKGGRKGNTAGGVGVGVGVGYDRRTTGKGMGDADG